VKRAALALALLTTTGVASAAPSRGPKVTVTDGDALVPSKKFTAAATTQRHPSFSPTKTYKTPSGATITGQQYLDIVNKLQAAAERGGCDLGSGKTCNFVAQEARLDGKQLTKAASLASAKLGLKKVAPKASPSATKAKDPLGFTWENEWGKRGTAAVYVGAGLADEGSNEATACGGAAYAGVYLFNQRQDVIRFEVEAASSGQALSMGQTDAGTPKVEAGAELFVMGFSVWSKSQSVSLEKLRFEKIFKVQKSLSYWGLVTINLSAKATAGAYISGTIGGVAKPGEFTCAINVTPGVLATLSGEAEVALVGYGPLSAAAVGVDADLTLADMSLPLVASASARASNGRITFSETLSADLRMSFLKGSLDVYFQTAIPLGGEKLYDFDKDKFSFTLLEFDGYTENRTLYSKTQTQNL
jgi:hypothetical protein